MIIKKTITNKLKTLYRDSCKVLGHYKRKDAILLIDILQYIISEYIKYNRFFTLSLLCKKCSNWNYKKKDMLVALRYFNELYIEVYGDKNK